MSNLEPKTLVATKHDNMAKYRKVFNLTEVEYYLYVKLEPPLVNIWYLYKVEEKTKDGSLIAMPISSGEVVRQSPTWLRFQTNFMNTSVGLHVYKLTFVHTVTNIVATLWFSYTIQNDNPDKPYIYMKREDVDPDDPDDDSGDADPDDGSDDGSDDGGDDGGSSDDSGSDDGDGGSSTDDSGSDDGDSSSDDSPTDSTPTTDGADNTTTDDNSEGDSHSANDISEDNGVIDDD